MNASDSTIFAKHEHTVVRCASVSSPPDFRDGVVFFDLAGTLVEPDARVSESRKQVLHRFATEPRRIVLVTGQAADDPQVVDICRHFVCEPQAQFVAYVTRGAVRLVKCGLALERDEDYVAPNRLGQALQNDLHRVIEEVLAETDLHPIIPVKCVDEVAMRINLAPEDRPKFMRAMLDKLLEPELRGFQAVGEGRTSVFVTRLGIGKRRAVLFELEQFAMQKPSGKAYFFGNEFHEGGNDREVLDIPDLQVMVLGGIAAGNCGGNVSALGRSPDDLYAFLQSYQHTGGRRPSLPVLFISLGGTKFKVGAITGQGKYFTEAEIHWRGMREFATYLDDERPSGFCDAVALWAERFLKMQGYEWHDVALVGIGLPGPCQDGRWHSFNLTRAFQTGVALDREFDEALRRLAGKRSAQRTYVVFDAQCDAGGELYHPLGRLRQAPPSTRREGAVVLNIATGIAAGFIKEGKVLVRDEDFVRFIGPSYDSGAGQIGRHLWYHKQACAWEYRYCPRGAVPEMEGAVRLTEYLSGPALAARLLVGLGQHDSLPRPDEWPGSQVTHDKLISMHNKLRQEKDETRRSRQVRDAGSPLATALLSWADDAYRCGKPASAASCIKRFAHEVADELAAALTTWAGAPGWEPFLKHVVLTGGVGIHFLASVDTDPDRSFLAMLKGSMPSGDTVARSQLSDSAERGAYFFWGQHL